MVALLLILPCSENEIAPEMPLIVLPEFSGSLLAISGSLLSLLPFEFSSIKTIFADTGAITRGRTKYHVKLFVNGTKPSLLCNSAQRIDVAGYSIFD